jgi:hypothetical protein
MAGLGPAIRTENENSTTAERGNIPNVVIKYNRELVDPKKPKGIGTLFLLTCPLKLFVMTLDAKCQLNLVFRSYQSIVPAE